ncbi:MAG TPA: hypothetical protein VGG02_10705 [Chthoniobacterales bacterium]|jgi:hypothetical protein
MASRSFFRNVTLLAALIFCFAGISSLRATIVTWDLNPSSTEGSVGSTSHTFSSSGYNITAYGYTVGYPNTPLGLYYKNGGSSELGLGVTSTSDHELQGNGWYPTQFIQLDVSSIVAQGFTNGKLQVNSVQGNDSFVIWGSNTLGSAGQQIGSAYYSNSNMTFVSIANFTSYKYISIGALNGSVLAFAFQAEFNAVPEMSALFPIVGLIVAIALTQLLRRRRIAQSRTASR